MVISNYHTHCRFCDGTGEPEDFIKKAINCGCSSIGFSSHAPLPFPNDWALKADSLKNYVQTVLDLKQAYQHTIDVYLGLEIDYLPGVGMTPAVSNHSPPLDYSIGSLHYLYHPGLEKYFEVDYHLENLTKVLKEVYRGDIRKLVAEYYEDILRMISVGRFDFIGHLDIIKKNNKDNRFFNEESIWYRKIMARTLEGIRTSGRIMEINSGGIARGTIDSTYPSPWVLAEACKLGIPIIISSDAHRPEDLQFYFDESLLILKDVGYREIYQLSKSGWKSTKITG
jgi:histidinol-phosphatase (PHP family)